MKPLKTLCLIILAAFYMAGCGSSKKSLQQGDYYGAVMEAIKQLRSSPDSRKQQEVLLQGYPLLKENGLRKIRNAMDANIQNKYCVAADEYLMLNQVADAIYSCPKALQLIPYPDQFSRELGDILPNAAEEAYRLGENRLSLNTIKGAREAFQFFAKASEYVNDYRDVNDKMALALDMAIFKVIVRKPVTPRNYQLTSDFFFDNLMAQMTQKTTNSFVRYYTEEEARNEGITRPDQYLDLDFNDFVVGAMRETKNTVELKRDSVLVGTTNVGGRSQNVYGTVKAQYTTFRREVISQGTLSVKIINAATNRTEQNQNFPGKFVWYNEWASYNGDERALTDSQKKKAKDEPVMPPPQQNLFIEFTKPILNQTVTFVKNYYKKM